MGCFTDAQVAFPSTIKAIANRIVSPFQVHSLVRDHSEAMFTESSQEISDLSAGPACCVG